MDPESRSEVEEYHFSFFGRPFTQIKAEVITMKPLGPAERAIDVKFAGGQYTVRILVDLVTTDFSQMVTTSPYIDGSPPERLEMP